MKTTLTIQAPAEPRKQSARKLLLRVIIFLTSSRFFIFVAVIATTVCWWGNLVDDASTVIWGALAFLAGFTPWAWRETIRGMHHPERFK